MISIGRTGEVIGDIKANNLIVSGLLDGKIDCNQVQYPVADDDVDRLAEEGERFGIPENKSRNNFV